MKVLPEVEKERRGPLEIIEGKNARIPIYDAGEGKVILAYYAEGKRKLVKCQSLQAGKSAGKGNHWKIDDRQCPCRKF